MQNKKQENQDLHFGKSFLQSSLWEEFQKSLGRDTFQVMGKLLIKMPLTLGQNYMYCPRSYCKYDQIFDFLDNVEQVARKEGAFFLRFEPVMVDEKINIKEIGARKVASRQPKQTLMIDLSNSSDEILANMKSKTRYNIRLAEKKGVKIVKSKDIKDVDVFYQIALQTAKRDKIKIHEPDYYKKMAEVFLKNNKFAIYIAKYDDKPIAANLMLYYDNIAYYLHGASSNEHRNMMSPFLLQWEAIKDAKKDGFLWYDFWGISPLEQQDTRYMIHDTNHPWYGISRFKLGFAPDTKTGKYVEYPGCYEISYGKKRYLLYSMFKKVM